MKKVLIIIASILTIIILSLVIIFVIDVFRFSDHKKPLIVLKVKHFDLEDGTITQYRSLGYEFLDINRRDIKGFEFNFGYTKSFVEEKEYRILYDGVMHEDCSSYSHLVYEDSQNKYYIECVDIDLMYVLHKNTKYSISEALDKK